MKIVTFWGGLGNTIIDYAYLQHLKMKYPREKFYSFFPKAGLTAHNGFELDKRFIVNLPPTRWYTNLIGYTLFYAMKVFIRLNLHCPLTSTMKYQHDDALFHCDWWQDKKFIPKDFQLEFRPFKLNEANSNILKIIKERNSISVHIRRGDYMQLGWLYSGICTEHYYETAINMMKKKVDNPFFIFFSDDPEWVKSQYHLSNMEVVDWNKGEDSFIDMFLMSNCKHMILANSTFSYWAARFNKGVKSVICPVRWNNSKPGPNLSLDNWIKVNPK